MRRYRFLLSAILTLAFLPVGRAALADAGHVQIRGIQTGSFPNVGVTLFVDGSVDPQQVEVTESGRPVQVLSVRPLFEAGHEVDVVLALDTSESVAGASLSQAVDAARQLLSTVPPGFRVGLITFSDRVRVLAPVTSDHAAVLEALNGIHQTQPGTALYDAVGTASGLFSGSAQHNVVLLTDGTDVGSRLDLPGAIAAAQRAKAAVFSVGLEGQGRNSYPALQQISAATKGSFNLAAGENLSALYAQLGQALSNQYLVQYRSSSAPGAQVTISVQTRLGSDSAIALIPRASNGFTAPTLPRVFLSGPWGLLLVLVLSFSAAFLLGSLLLGGRARASRDKELARRMAANPIDQSEVPPRPDGGIAAWIPEPIVQAGEAVAAASGFKTSLARTLERAGLPMTPGEVVAGSVLAGLAGLALGWFLSGNILIALAAGLVLGSLPYLLVSRTMNRRIGLLHTQLPDVLMILASSLRAGHSFQQALDTVSKEIGEPSGPEFSRVLTEVRLGRPFDQAMNALAERVGTEEFRWAVLGINVQREVGGNLAEILDILAETIREREAVRRQVKVLSAEGRMSVKVLLIIPFVITGYLAWISPDYMKLLWTTHLGLGFIAAGLVLMVVGALWARKVVKFDV
jgi:tight adherence protein B